MTSPILAIAVESDAALSRRRMRHWSVFWLSLSLVSAAFALRLDSEDRVRVPLLEEPLPSACHWKRVLGIECPGCGMTRSVVASAHGQWDQAWWFNPVGPMLFVAAAFQLPYRPVQVWRLSRGREELRLGSPLFYAWLIVTVLIIQWLVKLLL